ncbi:hypothetical protein CY34DRAFT_812993 [Suillus luteus UH-Slu-Lm8-n1]|uniref:Uncharacterized protein n=1 Tax=Suillus luteus UH-Slu-Lm8-n1 TaxID=930992 RepID=A0A0D0A883_9AGAM|nr:hypothetical protein CY34DRAFT_812993 [Suillus luteus UH-Slu-Lm8-n1]
MFSRIQISAKYHINNLVSTVIRLTYRCDGPLQIGTPRLSQDMNADDYFFNE